MFVCIACVEEIQTVCAGVALGWRRQLHDAEPVMLLVECHHGDELVLVDDVSIKNLELPVPHRLAVERSEEQYEQTSCRHSDCV
jgi:hypothetical protein